MKKIKNKNKWFLGLFIASTSLLVSAELVARYTIGLGSPPLYESSPDYGYRALPNQDLRRFGNRIFYNAQGLRSETIADKPAPGTIRVLCIGDSITFGGVQTDQSLTYPYQLQNIFNSDGAARFEVLNASTGGWAIGNEEAYLHKFGTYNSKIVVLQVATHDLFQPKTSGEMVGKTPNYPNQKPILALQEGFFRYFLPRYLPSLQPPLDPGVKTLPSKKDLDRNIATLVAINNLVQQQKGQLVVFLIQQPDEYEPKDALTKQGKQVLTQKVKELNLPFASLGEDFRKAGGKKLFYDTIHPNPEGNKLMAKAIEKLIKSELQLAKMQ